MLMALIQNRHRGRNEPVADPRTFMEAMNNIPKPPQEPEQQWEVLRSIFGKR